MLAGCVIIQSIQLSIMSSYSLEIKGNMELYVNYQKPKLLDDIGVYHRILDVEFIIALTNLISNVTVPSASMIIKEESISYLRIWQHVLNLYEYPSYLLRLDTKPRTFECAKVSEDSHVQLNYNFMLMLTITNFCGFGTYSKPAVYIYKYMIQPTNRVTKMKQTKYMIITTKRYSEDSNEPLDVITMILRDVILNSLDVIGDRMLYSETVDMTTNLLYEKASVCSTFQLQYRVEEVRKLFHKILSLKIKVVKLHHMTVSKVTSYDCK